MYWGRGSVMCCGGLGKRQCDVLAGEAWGRGSVMCWLGRPGEEAV